MNGMKSLRKADYTLLKRYGVITEKENASFLCLVSGGWNMRVAALNTDRIDLLTESNPEKYEF